MNNSKRCHQESEASSSSPARRRSCDVCKYFGNQCKEECLFAKYLRVESQTFNSIMQKFPPEKHQMVLLALFLCYKWIRKIPTGNRYRVLESLVADITASNSTTVDEMNQVLHYNVQRQRQRQRQPQPLPHIHQYSAQPRGGSGINSGQPNTTPGRGSSSGVNLGQASRSRGIINPGHQAITNNNPGVGGVGLPLSVAEFNNLLYRHGMINEYYTQQLQPMPRDIQTDEDNTSVCSNNPNVNLTCINNDLFDEDEFLLDPALRLAPHHEILQPTRSSSNSTQTSGSNLRIDLNEDITRQARDAPQGHNPKP